MFAILDVIYSYENETIPEININNDDVEAFNGADEDFDQESDAVDEFITRCSLALSDRVERFNQLRSCISKVLVDLEFGSDYWITEDEFNIMSDIDRALQPIKLAVEVLCRQDSNLFTA
ncbi:unnamed protein product [Parnassius apollo]|uniref:(apollo) hypothetical protein n=1 Tax=Parnassius apollo TaxID=110799 RepID=A0A8S3WHX0_PARAO|nr:unnamed protein product [Parnassius apollo]